jgi:hypothetical protein
MKVRILEDINPCSNSCFAWFSKGIECRVTFMKRDQTIYLEEIGGKRRQGLTSKVFRDWLREGKIVIIG